MGKTKLGNILFFIIILKALKKSKYRVGGLNAISMSGSGFVVRGWARRSAAENDLYRLIVVGGSGLGERVHRDFYARTFRREISRENAKPLSAVKLSRGVAWIFPGNLFPPDCKLMQRGTGDFPNKKSFTLAERGNRTGKRGKITFLDRGLVLDIFRF